MPETGEKPTGFIAMMKRKRDARLRKRGAGTFAVQSGAHNIGHIDWLPALLTAANLSALAAGLRVYLRRNDGKEYTVEQDGDSYTLKGLSSREAGRMLKMLLGRSDIQVEVEQQGTSKEDTTPPEA
jgi:hypothetical protein